MSERIPSTGVGRGGLDAAIGRPTKKLPTWADHPAFDKSRELQTPDSDQGHEIADWLAELQSRQDRPLRILDVGAGIGGLVAWLCAQGYDAYGVEPNGSYVSNSRRYFHDAGLGDRILGFRPDGSYPFEDNWFDVVLSHHTLEHVQDIESFGREVSRVTRPGGFGLHTFPAKWQPVEGHMRMPIVHWLPKGPARRLWIKIALGAGWAVPYFSDLSIDDRTEIFQRFSEDETFYRTARAISQVFDQHGIASDRLAVWSTRLLSRRRIKSLKNAWMRKTAARSFAVFFVAFKEPSIMTVKR